MYKNHMYIAYHTLEFELMMMVYNPINDFIQNDLINMSKR